MTWYATQQIWCKYNMVKYKSKQYNMHYMLKVCNKQYINRTIKNKMYFNVIKWPDPNTRIPTQNHENDQHFKKFEFSLNRTFSAQ